MCLYTRVQRLIGLRIAKAYRTISHEALCIITGTPPINIKVEEAVTLCNITKGRIIQIYQTDQEEKPKYWWTQLKLMTTLTKQLIAEKTVNAAFRYTQTAAKVKRSRSGSCYI